MPFRKKSYRRKKSSYGSKKTYKIATRAAKKVLSKNVERKHFEVANTNVSISTTATVNALTYPTQGVGENDRIGNEISLRWVKLKYYLTVADTTNMIRMIIFQWHVDTAIQNPGIGDILLDPTSNYAIVSPLVDKEGKRRKFTILSDKVSTLATQGTANTFKKVYIPKGFKRRLGFNSNNVTTGLDQIFMAVISDSAASLHPTMTWYTDACFTDM